MEHPQPDSVFMLQHPLANPKDPPVAVPTLPRHRQPSTHVPPTPTSLSYSLSPPGSPTLGSTGHPGVTPKPIHPHPGHLSLARDLTTRLWQREAELQTMKDLYDAKIRRLTEMLQDAGVSPTEVENNLAVVVEETDDLEPLFDQLSVTSSGGEGLEDIGGLFGDSDEEFLSSSGSLFSGTGAPMSRADHFRRTAGTRPEPRSVERLEGKGRSRTSVEEHIDRRKEGPSISQPFSPSADGHSTGTDTRNSIQGVLSPPHPETTPSSTERQGSQSPLPAFIMDSFTAGTLGMKTLREKWAMASGVLTWGRPKSEQASLVTSPSGIFIRNEGIINEKKPAVAEASIPSIPDGFTLSEKDPWSTMALPSSRKTSRSHPQRPMSDVGYGDVSAKYQAAALARDIPRPPPISRIHDFLQRPDSYTPSPLHYRAISMAANLIDTGAITPAKLYARRTQTMIAKWTLGLLMNTKPKTSPNSFPVIRESSLTEHDVFAEELVARPRGVEMTSSYARGSGMPSVADNPKALSFARGQASASNILSSSYQSSLIHAPHSSVTAQNVVELSDICPPPLSMSPTSSYLGDCIRPLTDRYGFIMNARPMAVQQGLMKLNQAYGADELDSPQLRQMGAFEYLRTPSEDSGRSASPPPTASPYFWNHVHQNNGPSTPGATPASLPTSITSPILSTATRPTSTLSPPTSSATVTTLLSQIKVLHDSVQMTQKEKWDAFLRKRRRRVHLGENMSSTNIGSPLFGSLTLSPEDEQEEDEYYTSICIIGISTIGKGSDWEEFRDLVRGGIPVMYRNKIWQEASGAYDMRQPGYYKELLSKQVLEHCQCWGDIEMDLHRTFPTNILFGPGGQGIEKLKNVLLAYSLHNSNVGYCQGMNLLAGTLLLTNNSEEESFWILASILGRHLPEDYFTQQLLSPQVDQRVLRELVQEMMPRLSDHFQEMHVDLTAVTFSWFLTLFTDCLPVETLLRVWDVFFVEGMLVVFKVAVAILWMNEKEILKCRNGAAVYCFLKQMTLGMHQADKLIKVAFVTLKSHIHPEKIEAKRLRHHAAVRQELVQEQQIRSMKTFTCAVPPSPRKAEKSTLAGKQLQR